MVGAERISKVHSQAFARVGKLDYDPPAEPVLEIGAVPPGAQTRRAV
jgi:hypothetical protein